MNTPTLVHDLLEQAATRWPQKTFLIDAAGPHSFESVQQRAANHAHMLLEQGLQVGDRVAILAANSRFFSVAYFGILQAGGVAVPLNTLAGKSSWDGVLHDCQASFLCVGETYQQQASELLWVANNHGSMLGERLPEPMAPASVRTEMPEPVALNAGHMAVVVYTSGTTSKPQGVMLSHQNIVHNTQAIVGALGLHHSDRTLVVLPFFYVYGASLLHTHAWVGASLVIENQFAFPQVALNRLAKEQCTGLAGVPSTFALLMDRTDLAHNAPDALRFITQAGGAMAPLQVERLQTMLPHCRIFLMYGATEATARLTVLQPEDWCRAKGSIGKPIAGVEMDIRSGDGVPVSTGEVGELWARGPNIMLGYWKNPQATAEVMRPGGWCCTGDLGYRDAAGFYYITGRAKDFIKAGAHRIAPKEIEEALLAHPDVHEVAVIGVSDALLGEKICAYVAWRDPSCPTDANELLTFARNSLPAFKVPHEIRVRESLPKNAAGKIVKQALS